MLKNLIQKLSADSETLKKNKYLRIFGKIIYASYLWNLNRRSVARAFAIGIFWSLIPIPIQMLMAAICAIVWRGNLPLSLGLVWLTNPITVAPIYYVTYKIGAWILNTPPYMFNFELSWTWIEGQAAQIWKPLFLGSFICGLMLAGLIYYVISVIWVYSVKRRYRLRKNRCSSF